MASDIQYIGVILNYIAGASIMSLLNDSFIENNNIALYYIVLKTHDLIFSMLKNKCILHYTRKCFYL